jgi:NADH-quinone oxidoreductase subunit M
MLCHGIATGALFILVGALQERTHTRDMRRLGGLWETVPRMGGIGLLFALASLGLPGLGNFVGEFLTLVGAYAVSVLFTVLAALGLIASTVYALWMIQLTFYGPNKEGWKLPDFSGREMAMMTALIAVIIWLGLYPQPVLNTARPALVGQLAGASRQTPVASRDVHRAASRLAHHRNRRLATGDWRLVAGTS